MFVIYELVEKGRADTQEDALEILYTKIGWDGDPSNGLYDIKETL